MSGGEPGPADGVRVARLPAEVDVANAMDLRAELSALLADGVRVVIADMADTTALTLEGLQALLLVRAAASRQGAQLRLASLQPQVLRFMVLTGTDRLFPLYDKVERARAVTRDEPPEPLPLA